MSSFSQTGAHRPARILVVDDDRLIGLTLSSSLRAAGYDVNVAQCGQAAQELSDSFHPDLVILDLSLPDVPGLVVAEHLRDTEIPFFFLSAYNDADSVQKALQCGALSYLLKPLIGDQIILSVEAALQRAQDFRQLRREHDALAAALSNEESRFRQLIDALPLLIAYIDTDQRYRFVNHTFENWYGRTRASMEGETILAIDGEDRFQALRQPLERCLAGEFVAFDSGIDCPDGRRRQIRSSYVPHRDSRGIICGLFALQQDVTEPGTFRAECELVNRNRAELLSEIAQELRTPMHAVLSYSRYGLDKQKQSVDKLRDHFAEILHNTERMMMLVENLLDLSMVEVGQLKLALRRTDVCALASLVIEELRPLFEHRDIAVDRQFAVGTIHACIDADRLAQILRNLLSNAYQHSAESQRIVLRIAPVDDGDAPARAGICIEVADEGPGIPSDQLDHIFERYVQSSARTSGLDGKGLGLAVCRELVRLHDGRIWAANRAEGGASFTVWLPSTPVE